MDFYTKYKIVAGNLFNKYVEPQLTHYRNIHKDLRMANIPIMLREYISMVYLSAVLAFVISIPVSILLAFLILGEILLSLLVGVIAAAIASTATFFLALEYPAMIASDRKRSIDNNLPFATLYMNTIAGTGAPPDLMFKLLSEFKEYGEVSKEAQSIVEDLEVMGQDVQVALERAAERTPSTDFKDLLWSMTTTIVRGGDMKALLQAKSNLLMDAYRRKMDEYTNDLSMYVEIYITLIIVGSIFSIVMLTIMGAISGFESLKAIQQILVFVFLPVASIAFIVLLKLTSPLS